MATAIAIGNMTFGNRTTPKIKITAPASDHGDMLAQAASRFFVGSASQNAAITNPTRKKPPRHKSQSLVGGAANHKISALARHISAITPTSGRLIGTRAGFRELGDVRLRCWVVGGTSDGIEWPVFGR
jgi:hypothetical protein